MGIFAFSRNVPLENAIDNRMNELKDDSREDRFSLFFEFVLILERRCIGSMRKLLTEPRER